MREVGGCGVYTGVVLKRGSAGFACLRHLSAWGLLQGTPPSLVGVPSPSAWLWGTHLCVRHLLALPLMRRGCLERGDALPLRGLRPMVAGPIATGVLEHLGLLPEPLLKTKRGLLVLVALIRSSVSGVCSSLERPVPLAVSMATTLLSHPMRRWATCYSLSVLMGTAILMSKGSGRKGSSGKGVGLVGGR